MTERCLGDTVMTLPLINLLETRWNELSFVAPGYAGCLLAAPNRRFLPAQKASGFRQDLAFARTLRQHRFDTVIVAKASFRSAWIAKLSGIPRRIGLASEGRGFLLTDTVPYEQNAYYAYSMLDLARPLGFSLKLERPRFMPSGNINEAAMLLDGATIGIQPGATSERKRISPEVLRLLVQCLHSSGQRVALIGGPDERSYADALLDGLNCPVVDLVGRTDFSMLAAVVSQLCLMVGGDTGVLHLAAATGTTTVQVFGPTQYKGWGNLYGANQVLVAHDGNVKSITDEQLIQTVYRALSASKEPKSALAI